MLKKLKKKRKGFIDDVLPTLLFITAAMIALIFTVNIDAGLQSKNSLNYIGRQTMLKMESDGYLTETAKKDLAKKLSDKGFYSSATECKNKSESNTIDSNFASLKVPDSNLSVSGKEPTTVGHAKGYGQKIYLAITVYKMSNANTINVWGHKTPTKMTVYIESTSKQ